MGCPLTGKALKTTVSFAFFFITLIATAASSPTHWREGRTASVCVLMAVLWMTNAIPMAATALVPLVFFPLLGIESGKQVATAYFNDTMWVFLGSFMMATAVEQVNLHRRIALFMLKTMGVKPRQLLLGFMISSALLSTCISNTATAIMMIPIATAVLARIEANPNASPERVAFVKKYKVGLVLGCAYASSIGGIITLTGTGPNLVFATTFATLFPKGPEISYARWFLFGCPVGLFVLAATFVLLSFKYTRGGSKQHLASSSSSGARRQKANNEGESAGMGGGGAKRSLTERIERGKRGEKGERHDMMMAESEDNSSSSVTDNTTESFDKHDDEDDEEATHGGGMDDGEHLLDVKVIEQQWHDLGEMKFAEKFVVVDLLMLMVLWFFRDPKFFPGWAQLLPKPDYATDGTAAIMMSLLLFFVPVTQEGKWGGWFVSRIEQSGMEMYEYHSSPLVRGREGSQSLPPLDLEEGRRKNKEDEELEGDEESRLKNHQHETSTTTNSSSSSTNSSSSATASLIRTSSRPLIVGGGWRLVRHTTKKDHRLFDWEGCKNLSWDVVLLLGGGFALSSGFKESGLSEFVARNLCSLSAVPPQAALFIISTVVTFFTEVNSNVSSAVIFLPIVAEVAGGIGINPLFLMVPSTISCSFAFMLPVATPPNAVAFGTGAFEVHEMMKIGIILNIMCVVVVVFCINFIGPFVFEQMSPPPAWALRNDTCG